MIKGKIFQWRKANLQGITGQIQNSQKRKVSNESYLDDIDDLIGKWKVDSAKTTNSPTIFCVITRVSRDVSSWSPFNERIWKPAPWISVYWENYLIDLILRQIEVSELAKLLQIINLSNSIVALPNITIKGSFPRSWRPNQVEFE